MRRLAAVVSVIAVLVLTGCSSEQRTSASACSDVVGSWEAFMEFAQTPGRDDAEMANRRAEVLATWRVAEVPEWTGRALSPAVAALEGAVAGDDVESNLVVAIRQVDVIRDQCESDGLDWRVEG